MMSTMKHEIESLLSLSSPLQVSQLYESSCRAWRNEWMGMTIPFLTCIVDFGPIRIWVFVDPHQPTTETET